MTDYSELLTKQDKKTLVNLLANFSEKYPEIENEMCAKLGVLDEKKEIKEIKQILRQAIRTNTHRGFINSHSCDMIMSEFDDVIEMCLERAKQSYYVMAYSVLLDVIELCTKLASTADSSNGTMITTMEHAFGALTLIADTLSFGTDEVIKKDLFNAIIRTSKKKVFEGWDEYRYLVLQTGIGLVTPKNASKMLKTSHDFIEANESTFVNKTICADDLIIQIMVMQRLGNQNKAIALMDENLQHNSIRQLRIAYAMEAADYKTAEKLILAKIEERQNIDYYWLQEWHELLDMVYEETNQVFKRIENLKTMIKNGDVPLFPVLKQLLIEESFWEEDYPQLLKNFEQALDPSYYAYILELEKEWEKLYYITKQHPSLIEFYGKDIYSDFPKEVTETMYEWVNTRLKEVSERKGYRKVAKLILSYTEYGETEEAIKWVEEIKNKPSNKRKTALQDEMNKVLYTLV